MLRETLLAFPIESIYKHLPIPANALPLAPLPGAGCAGKAKGHKPGRQHISVSLGSGELLPHPSRDGTLKMGQQLLFGVSRLSIPVFCSTPVGIVPPRTKSPTDEDSAPTLGVVRRSSSSTSNGLNSRVLCTVHVSAWGSGVWAEAEGCGEVGAHVVLGLGWWQRDKGEVPGGGGRSRLGSRGLVTAVS